MADVINAADEMVIELFSGLPSRHFAKLVRRLRTEGPEPALMGRPRKLACQVLGSAFGRWNWPPA